MAEFWEDEGNVPANQVLEDHRPQGFWQYVDGQRECYCGYVLGEGESLDEHIAGALSATIKFNQGEQGS